MRLEFAYANSRCGWWLGVLAEHTASALVYVIPAKAGASMRCQFRKAKLCWKWRKIPARCASRVQCVAQVYVIPAKAGAWMRADTKMVLPAQAVKHKLDGR